MQLVEISKALAKNLGLMPQSPIVPEGITVADLVARGRFPYRQPLKGMSKEDYQIVSEAMDMMGISDLADRCVDELSGGQRQRVWLALALAQDTDILLLDEPTTFDTCTNCKNIKVKITVMTMTFIYSNKDFFTSSFSII